MTIEQLLVTMIGTGIGWGIGHVLGKMIAQWTIRKWPLK